MRKKSIEDQLSAFAATIKDYDDVQKYFLLEILVDCDLDVERACSLLGLELQPCQLSIFDTEFTNLLKTLPALAVDERRKEIRKIVTSQLSASGSDPGPSTSGTQKPSEWQKKKLKELMVKVESDKKAGVEELFQDTNFDITLLRDLLGLPPLDPNDVDPESPDFEALNEFKTILEEKLPSNEHHEALLMLRDNKYNVQATCSHIGLHRFKSQPRKRGQQIAFCPKYNTKQQNIPVWPDHDNMIQADYDMQIQSHPCIIDLHYFTLQEASECVDRLIRYHKKLETPEVFITTGKGINSASKNTIKKQTMKQLRAEKINFKVNPRNSGQLIVTFF